jgi:hypothetical protein
MLKPQFSVGYRKWRNCPILQSPKMIWSTNLLLQDGFHCRHRILVAGARISGRFQQGLPIPDSGSRFVPVCFKPIEFYVVF